MEIRLIPKLPGCLPLVAPMASETTKKIASNTFYQLAGKVISMSVTILATVIITRTYGREGYGSFNLMQTFPALFFIIVDFGLNAIATRELASDWSKAREYLSNVFTIRLLLSFSTMVVAALALIFFPYAQALKTGIYLSLFLILTQALYATMNIVFQVRLRYDLSNIGYVLGSLAVLLLVLVLSYFHYDVKWVSFSYVIGGLITFLVNLNFVRCLGVKLSLGFDKRIIKFLLIQSLPLGLMFVFSQINFKMDAILISVMRLPARFGLDNTGSVAVYGLPYKVFEVSLVIPTFFMNAAYPVLVRHMIEGKEKLRDTFVRTLASLSGGGLVFGLLGVLFAPLIIRILGGDAFSQSIPVLRILLGGLVLFYTTQPLSWLIVTLGGQRYLPWVYLISAVFNVMMNVIFIPRYSFYGSSVITLLSELLILVLLTFFARKVWKDKYA